jgi:hypothetical protein
MQTPTPAVGQENAALQRPARAEHDPAALQRLLRELMALGITEQRLLEALAGTGITRGCLQHWRYRRAPSAPDARTDVLRDLRGVVAFLRAQPGWDDDALIHAWLRSVHRGLGWTRPLDAIASRREDVFACAARDVAGHPDARVQPRSTTGSLRRRRGGSRDGRQSAQRGR